jgi:hypothetical protein
MGAAACCLRTWLVCAALWGLLSSADSAFACDATAWKGVEEGIEYRDSCYRYSGNREFRYTVARYDPAKFELRLVGGMPDLSIPSASTIKYNNNTSYPDGRRLPH